METVIKGKLLIIIQPNHIYKCFLLDVVHIRKYTIYVSISTNKIIFLIFEHRLSFFNAPKIIRFRKLRGPFQITKQKQDLSLRLEKICVLTPC